MRERKNWTVTIIFDPASVTAEFEVWIRRNYGETVGVNRSAAPRCWWKLQRGWHSFSSTLHLSKDAHKIQSTTWWWWWLYRGWHSCLCACMWDGVVEWQLAVVWTWPHEDLLCRQPASLYRKCKYTLRTLGDVLREWMKSSKIKWHNHTYYSGLQCELWHCTRSSHNSTYLHNQSYPTQHKHMPTLWINSVNVHVCVCIHVVCVCECMCVYALLLCMHC